jgi:hypothetical protein
MVIAAVRYDRTPGGRTSTTDADKVSRGYNSSVVKHNF